ncbi:MAG: hypothetical protein U5J99_02855 [Parvularculaceae bacterium]|nr:hypothetical protein [Parvularculaceae bacterium]
MRTMMIAVSAGAMAMFAAADAQPLGAAKASSKAAAEATLIEALASLVGVTAYAKATPSAGTKAPNVEECEGEKKRSEAARSAETRRTAEAEKQRSRSGEPLYLAF